MSNGAILSAERVIVRSRRREILEDVTFEVGRGRILAVVGANGAGKSTLLHAVAGLVVPASGRIDVFAGGRDAKREPRTRIGFSPDALRAFPAHTPRQHLRMVAALIGVGPENVDREIERVGLSPRRDSRVSSFSLGMRRRLSLATAMLGDPPLLVLDEPFNGLDPDAQRWMVDDLRARARTGTTVVLSAHGISALDGLADDLLVLERGRIRASGAVDQLTRTLPVYLRVAATRESDLRELVRDLGATVMSSDGGELLISGVDAVDVATASVARGVFITTLATIAPSVRDFLDLATSAGEDVR